MDPELLVLLLEDEEEEENALCEAVMITDNVQPMFQRRDEEGTFNQLVNRHLMDNDTKFREYFRLSPRTFEEVISYVENDLSRYRRSMTAWEKLCLILRYMATGESYRSLAFQFRTCHQHVSRIVKEVVSSIRINMLSQYLPEPSMQSWLENAEMYKSRWNFPNAIGAIDGKHVRILCPKKSGSLFFNYKQFFSVVPLAIVDANYKFVVVDVGAYGKNSDSDIFKSSAFGKNIIDNTCNIPPPTDIGDGKILPHVILGDEAFALDLYMMKPYSQKTAKTEEKKRVFNYRLCRARRTTENAFGILCERFRVFFLPIAVNPETADDIIISSCILHNILRDEDIRVHGIGNVDGEQVYELPANNLNAIERTRARNYTKEAETVRQQFAEFFYSNEGSIPWQLHRVRRT